MGTQLIERGMKIGECGMCWNAERPDDIVAVHQAYRDAGCRLITTNSFGGTRSMLERHGLGGKVAEWNRLAAKLAAEAAGPEGWVIGDVGPFGDFLEPMGDTTVEELEAIFREQIAALVEGGADAILVETMSDPGEFSAGIRAAKAATDLPVIGTYAFQKSARRIPHHDGHHRGRCDPAPPSMPVPPSPARTAARISRWRTISNSANKSSPPRTGVPPSSNRMPARRK